ARLGGLPGKIEFAASKNGWTPDQDFPTTLDAADPSAVTVTWSDLAPQGGKGRAIRAKDQVKIDLDGLEGGKLSPGKPAHLKAKVYVGGDTPPGKYAGKATVTVKSADGRQSVKDIPVELTVTR
ncbi:MAG TPA: hypothetical protein VHF22_16000, partial [Planctomycetota bacterium]|nr:hypothetical protein [Planctomycetota bacterium]